MPATLISIAEAKEITAEACKIAASSEPTKTQLRLARFAKILQDGAVIGRPTHKAALDLARYFRDCPGDNDSELDDTLTNIARSLAVSRDVVDPILKRLMENKVTKMAQLTPDLLADYIQDAELQWLTNEGVANAAMPDAFGMLIELQSRNGGGTE